MQQNTTLWTIATEKRRGGDGRKRSPQIWPRGRSPSERDSFEEKYCAPRSQLRWAVRGAVYNHPRVQLV